MPFPLSSWPLEVLIGSSQLLGPKSCGHSDGFLFFIPHSLSMANTSNFTFKIQNLITTHFLHCYHPGPHCGLPFPSSTSLKPILYPWPEKCSKGPSQIVFKIYNSSSFNFPEIKREGLPAPLLLHSVCLSTKYKIHKDRKLYLFLSLRQRIMLPRK